MDEGVVILLVVSATAVSVAGYGVRECPPWFEWVNRYVCPVTYLGERLATRHSAGLL